MSEHFIFARPAVVTEERLKEAAAKAARQKAMKETLDRQIIETERVRDEARRRRAGGSKAETPREDVVNHSPHTPTSRVQPQKARAVGRKRSTPLEKAPTMGDRGAGPAPPPSTQTMEPARYTFTFEEGSGKFTREVGKRGPTSPSAGADKPHNNREENASPATRSPRVPSLQRSPGGADVESGSRASPSQSPLLGVTPDGKGHRLSPTKPAAHNVQNGAKRIHTLRRAGPSLSTQKRAVAGAKGTHETASLPADFALGVKPVPARSQAREGDAPKGGHDSRSLPAELAYRIGAGKDLPQLWGNGPHNQNVSATPPLKPLPGPRATSGGRDSVSASSTHSATDMYSRDCLPRDFNMAEELRKFREKLSPTSATTRLLSPRGGKGAPSPQLQPQLTGGRQSPRTPHRPAGGVLPPLEQKRRTSDSPSIGVIELSGASYQSDERSWNSQVATAQHGGGGRALQLQRSVSKEGRAQGPAQVRAGSQQPAGWPNAAVEILQRKLDSRDEQMKRMLEKERAWEQQVKQLKVELRNARKKERDLNRMAVDHRAAPPRRAETAPDKAPPPARRGLLAQRTPQPGRRPPQQLEPIGRNLDFTKACILTAENFRAITAPDFAGSSGDGAEALGHPDALEDSTEPLVEEFVEEFEFATLSSRQTTLGLPEEAANQPVPIEYEHLLQFASAQIITAQQADRLWAFFKSRSDGGSVASERGKGEWDVSVMSPDAVIHTQLPREAHRRPPREYGQEVGGSRIPAEDGTDGDENYEGGGNGEVTDNDNESDRSPEATTYDGEDFRSTQVSAGFGEPALIAMTTHLSDEEGASVPPIAASDDDDESEYEPSRTPVLTPALRRKISRYNEGTLGEDKKSPGLLRSRSGDSWQELSPSNRSPHTQRTSDEDGGGRVSSQGSQQGGTAPEDQLMLLRKRHNLGNGLA